MRKEKESPQSQTAERAGRTNSGKSGDKSVSMTRDILVDSLGEESKEIILS